ncbi:MAG TPA: hypothetical protein DCE41_22835 [Cytophagales bacterium]|nr:hypothetical protein [Cytophagales bacterium]HAA22884.1 hypothetical protein [Cytophagales bacterium]HAP60550.1 hypothetical protein [Cytophagales bacterium]
MTNTKAILSTLVNISHISVEIVNYKQRAVMCDSGWAAHHLGYEEEEFISLSENFFQRIIHPEDWPTQLEAYECFIDQKDTKVKEVMLRMLRKDGEYERLQFRITVLEWDRHGKPKKYLCVVSDVKEVLALRQQIAHQMAQLDQISFKNNHELRAPVASILGLVNLLDHEGFETSYVRDIINLLKQTVIKLDSVIKEINEHTY